MSEQRPLFIYDVQLLVRDPISAFDSTRFRRVEAETPMKAANRARREFNKNCAPIEVRRIISVVEAR